jgi:hypothetical protein
MKDMVVQRENGMIVLDILVERANGMITLCLSLNFGEWYSHVIFADAAYGMNRSDMLIKLKH